MTVELVGLAFDQRLTDQLWFDLPLEQTYDLILEDEFRRRVDLRSLLYHKGVSEILTDLEQLIRQGGARKSIVKLQADRFRAGSEEFPSQTGELSFDFRLIRQFSSLAMVDDFLVADPFLRSVLRKTGFLKNGSAWSLLETRDYPGIAKALTSVRIREISDMVREAGVQKVSYEGLIRNYIEFLGYASNNGLTPFFYNSGSDFRRWGNLTERKNSRGERIVNLSFRKVARDEPSALPRLAPARRKPEKLDLATKVRRKKETEALLGGLKDPDPLIRQKSAESMSRIADPGLFTHLVECLSDEQPEVRQELVRAIAATGDRRAEEVLLDILEKDEVFSVQLTAAFLLRKRGARSVLSALVAGMEKGKPHFPTLLAFHPLLKKDRPTHLRLVALAKSEAPGVRREVAYVLGFCPPKIAKSALAKLVKDTDEWTRIHALYALWGLRDPSVSRHAKEFGISRSEHVARAGSILSYWSLSKKRGKA